MKVEIWSDYVCPFCYMGLKKFEEALDGFAHKGEVEVLYRSYELAPDLPKDGAHPVAEMLMEKYRLNEDQARENLANITTQAATLGLDFHFEKAITCNTYDAHRLAHLAEAEGQLPTMHELLFQAHFCRGINLSDRESLLQLALEAGLEEPAVRDLLETERYGDDVRLEELQANNIGVRGVPFFLFDDRLAVSGAQQPEAFLEALEKTRDLALKEKRNDA